MTPKKLPSGNYRALVFIGIVDGKRKYKSVTAPTYSECKIKAAAVLTNRKQESADPTIKKICEDYIASKEPVLSPSTVREYERIFTHDLPPLYDVRLSELDSLTLQKWISSMNLSPKTVANRYHFLASALNMVTDRRFKVTLPQKKEPRRTVATDEDIKRLLEAADPELKKAILLGSCSLRRGEICALKYEDIKGNALMVHADIVHDRYNAWVYKDRAKTPESTRAVYVSDDIIKALGSGEGFIVKVCNPNALTQSFTHLRDRLGINVSLHSLRRFYASICHVLGVPDKYIMMQGGWKSRQTMEKSYQQIMDDKLIEYTERFENHFSSLMQHESNTERAQTRINTE